MQEPEKTMETENTARKKPVMVIIVAAASVVVLLAALFIAHSIFGKSYSGHLDRLKTMVTEEAAKFEQGDSQADAAGQYTFYLQIEAQAANLADILAKLNEAYPLLLTKANEKTVGLEDLKQKIEAVKPGLMQYKQSLDENGAINAELAAILGKAASADYDALIARNTAAQARIAGLSFPGALETHRSALEQGFEKRGAALQFLMEDAQAGESFAAILADVQAAPDELIARLNELVAKNQELAGKAEETYVASYGAGGASIGQAVTNRQQLLGATIAYLTEIKAVMADVAAFNGKLEQGLGQGTKFTERLAAWMAWVKDFNALEAQLKAVNDKPEYAGIETKRAMAAMGLSEMGTTLLSYAPALNAVNSAMASSVAIEKEITNVMKSKARMVDKVTTMTNLLVRDDNLLAKLNVELPADLSEGLANFKAACDERNVFLTEYMGYVKNQAVAEGQAANRRVYQQKYSDYKALAMTYPAGSSDRTFYTNLANDQLTFANRAREEYNASIKAAQAHKKAYEASRKKYLPMLDKVD